MNRSLFPQLRPCRWISRVPLFLAILAAFVAASGAASDRPQEGAASLGPGFLASLEAERKAEEQFLAVANPEKIRGYLRALTEEPHVAGTPQGLRAAEYVRDRQKEFGLDPQMIRYEVLINLPKSASLKMTLPEPRDIGLREAGVLRDKDSFSRDVFPAFHGFGASGRASGQIVYANYGRKEDFEKLEEIGVSVKGRVVIVRYGEVFRGLK